MEGEAVVAPVKVLYRGHEIWVFAQDDGIPVGTAVILENNIQVMSIPPSRFENILLAETQVLRHAKFWVDHHLKGTSQI
ncbi:hypothetical protein [Comamonas antarctica]|uniref:Uncharacterized protein n=1 Tax=Comamonas antarctica TaxID=2743470 RepID=A0A6N1X035_9BURK|nr:hypothetical protein [Comamonas antarctica]QKV52617.1 hypothetical protein HUK68_06710 [Comamonas antarctica]